ncbi:MAG: Ig-like domain-containing protein, partial [Thermoguttaceae bacterium]
GNYIETVTNPVASATTTVVFATAASSTAGQYVGFLAAVRPVAPGAGVAAGSVTFMAGATTLGTAPLDANGNAILFTASLPVGSDAITAYYAGNATFIASTSGNYIETVSAAPGKRMITASPAGAANLAPGTSGSTAPTVHTTVATAVAFGPTAAVNRPLAPAAVDHVMAAGD